MREREQQFTEVGEHTFVITAHLLRERDKHMWSLEA